MEENRVKGPPPFFRRRVLTLSLEGKELRLLSSWGGSVEFWGSLPLPPGLVRGGQVADASAMGEFLLSSLRSRSLLPARLCSSFPGLGVLTRTLALPLLRGVDLGEVVAREARRHLGVTPEGHRLFWSASGGSGKGGLQRVLVVAVPQEALHTLLGAFSVAGLALERLELKTLALARCRPKGDALLAHVESNSLELAVTVQGYPALLRTVFLGDDFPREMVAARVVEEVGRTLAFYRESSPALPLGEEVPLSLTGGLAEAPGDSLVAAHHSLAPLALAPLEVPLSLPGDFPLARFMVNLGLLLGSLKRP